MPEFGWNAIVLCCDFSQRYSIDPTTDWITQTQTSVEKKLDAWNNEESLVIPLPSLSYKGIIDKWWHKLTFTKSNGTFSAKPGMFNHAIRKICTAIKLFKGDYSQAWQPVAFSAAESIIQRQKVDVVLAEHGPDASLYVAKKIHHEMNIPWVADFRDPILQPLKPRIRSSLTLYYKRLLKSASLLINVTPYWSELDKEFFSKTTLCIPNGFDHTEYNKQTIPNPSKETIDIWVIGSIKGHQSLDVLIEAVDTIVEKNAELRNRVVVNYQGYSTQQFKESIANAKYKDAYIIHDATDRAALFHKLENAEVLVILSSNTKELFYRNGFLPGKVFEYMGLRKFVINIPGDKGILDQIIMETGIGKTFSSSDLLANFLLEASRNKDILRIPYSSAVEKYSRRNNARLLAEEINKVVKQSVFV